MLNKTYVLVTPVLNEVRTIRGTVQAVTSQTISPREWLFVSGGSVDGTDEIIRRAAVQHPWIRLVVVPSTAGRSFATVVRNTARGVELLETTSYDFLGLLDADVTFAPDYFEQLLRRFESEPLLGLAGGVVFDVGEPAIVPRNRQDVPGAVQFFRRECFESLGGLLAIPEGGWDALTCAVARMRGFRTKLFIDLPVAHHKPRNSAQGGMLRRRMQMGERDYAIGYHPLFELLKCLSLVPRRPWLIGALAWGIGYCIALVRRRDRVVPGDVIRFVRTEQMRRLLTFINRKNAPDVRLVS